MLGWIQGFRFQTLSTSRPGKSKQDTNSKVGRLGKKSVTNTSCYCPSRAKIANQVNQVKSNISYQILAICCIITRGLTMKVQIEWDFDCS